MHIVQTIAIHMAAGSDVNINGALGALTVAFFASLPLIGWIVQLLVLMIGLGALRLERRDSWQRLPAESHA